MDFFNYDTIVLSKNYLLELFLLFFNIKLLDSLYYFKDRGDFFS